MLLLKNSMYGGGHVKYALRQLDPETGALVDDLIQQLQNEIIRIAGLQHLQFTYIQVPPGGVRLLVEPLDDGGNGIALGFHTGLILEDQEEPVPDGVAGHALADLFDVVLDHLPAGFVCLRLRAFLHPLHIVGSIRRKRPSLQLEVVRRDLQIGGVAGNDGRIRAAVNEAETDTLAHGD